MTAPAGWLRPVAIAFAVVAVLLLAASAPAIAALRYPDPDDVLRMVQVRDLLTGQGWFDLTQHRLDAPNGGVPMHWSRLVDIPLAALLGVLTPLLGPALAETVTAVVVPLVTLGCALALAGRLAARLCGKDTVLYACLALALSVPLLSQVLPLRIDHHGWQIVLALAALAAVMSPNPGIGGRIAAAAMAAWLSISLEGLPMIAAISGVLALRWLRDPADKAWFVNAMVYLWIVSVLLFIATRGWGDLTNHCDAMSPVHLMVLGWAGIASFVLLKLDPRSKPALLAGLGAIAAGGGAILLAIAPTCARGGFAGMDPLVEAFWYRGIAEGQPLWQQPVGTVLQSVIPPLLGLCGVWSLWRRAEDDGKRALWLDYALLLGAALAVALLVTRAGAVAGAFAAVPFGWRLQRWLAQLGAARPPVKAGIAMAALALAVLVALPGTRYWPFHGAVQNGAPAPQRANECRVTEAAPALAALPRGEILAPMDIGPRLLHDTPHTVIASAHHRGEKGMRFAIELFLGSSGKAHAALRERGTAYVALCPGSNETARFRSASPNGLLAQLDEGRRVDWLQPVAMPAASNLKVWRIEP
jgi:hypothetical protein